MSEENELQEARIEIAKVETGVKFSLNKFFTGIAKVITDKFFLGFAVSTYFVQHFVGNGQTDDIKMALIIAWASITIVWFLATAISKFIEKGSLDVKLTGGFGLTKTITDDTKKTATITDKAVESAVEKAADVVKAVAGK